MNVNEDELIKRKEFKNLLIKLSKTQDVLETDEDKNNIKNEIESIYRCDDGQYFRHFYSDILSVI